MPTFVTILRPVRIMRAGWDDDGLAGLVHHQLVLPGVVVLGGAGRHPALHWLALLPGEAAGELLGGFLEILAVSKDS